MQAELNAPRQALVGNKQNGGVGEKRAGRRKEGTGQSNRCEINKELQVLGMLQKQTTASWDRKRSREWGGGCLK